MADQNRTTAAPLISELLRNPHQFTFYQAVRLLNACTREAVPPGRTGPANREQLRFRPHASFAFPTSDVESVEQISAGRETDSVYRMTVTFTGLYSSVSPLPAFYTEELIAGNETESNRRDFLDLFHHRIISLIYRSWEKYRYYLQFQPGGRDQFSQWMYAVVGLGGAAQREGLELDWERLLAYIGLLSMRSRSAPTLARIISHYFRGLPVAIQQCVERWVVIDHSQQARLGADNCSLGKDCTIGERVLDRSGKFRVCAGPLGFADFRKYLPDGQAYRPLQDLVRFSLRDPLEFDLSLTLLKDEIPDLDLGAENPCRLGWSTWLGDHPDDDACVELSCAAV
jgi:type VI secretion system protein ImpH